MGAEVLQKHAILDIATPYEHGIVTNIDQAEKVWQYMIYYKARRHPEEHPVVLVEKWGVPTSIREKHMETMFDTFYVPGYYAMPAAVAILKSAAAMLNNVASAVVVDIGATTTDAVVYQHGEYVANSHVCSRLGGEHLTLQLALMLIEQGYKVPSLLRLDAIRTYKEQLAFVAPNYASCCSIARVEEVVVEAKGAMPAVRVPKAVAEVLPAELTRRIESIVRAHDIGRNFEVPHKGDEWAALKIPGDLPKRLVKERFMCTEPLFDPTLLRERQDVGCGVLDVIMKDSAATEPRYALHELIYMAVDKCENSVRDDVYGNVLLAGGSCQLPGIAQRLQAELARMWTARMDYEGKVTTTAASPWRVHIAGADAALRGAAMHSAEHFTDFNGSTCWWVSKDDYDTHGPTMVHNKCSVPWPDTN
eukprot:TRINITY_DN2710_c0_g1_i5.p1 TRINITY_DN2710_c0_g1~~TRINITY_DN2710_c0_g1_i5.p1  ORF type:complete len:419 (-),score=67.51 TRINITY_DN2710_c0_g1_i5:2-1258(-)